MLHYKISHISNKITKNLGIKPDSSLISRGENPFKIFLLFFTITMHNIPYRTKFSQTKLTKFLLCAENFVI